MNDFLMRVYYSVRGGHVHVRIFVGKAYEGATLGKAGNLCLTNEEFQAWKAGSLNLQFKNEDAD
jgi:hypothetical protein